MYKQKFYRIYVLGMLFMLGVIYCANVFVAYHQEPVVAEMAADFNDNTNDSSEENVKETSHHLFLQERALYQLKPMNAMSMCLSSLIESILPDAYLQLNTPPPDVA